MDRREAVDVGNEISGGEEKGARVPVQENLPRVVVCATPHIHLEWPLVVGAPSGVQVAIRLSLMAGWRSGRRAQSGQSWR